ncbi:MAG: TonB-dependent receptor [Pseudomonadota bacterium]
MKHHLLPAVMLATAIPCSAIAEENRRQIEEVIVTAERQEASVQDTSISITAFTSESMEQFGIRNQSDLQNFVPATTIQPYDAAVRGVGRNFRNLGGDPGVATYMNGVYSEDLYTATIGSFWDIERIEVLRGPQGTLYGRNAVGGAMNFIYKGPTDTLDASVKAILGNYDTRDLYGYVSGPLVEGKLLGRFTFSSRNHDGWVEERGTGPDLDSGNEDNFSVQLEWLINDSMSVRLRSNQANVDRVMGGAAGAGLIVLRGENPVNGERDFTSATHAVRNVDPAQTNPLADDFLSTSLPILNYTNPTTGAPILAQQPIPGVHEGADLVNQGRFSTAGVTDCLFLDRENIDGDDLCAYTNGLNNETFDQQGNQLEFSWDISDTVTFKYILGYNDLLYERTTDDDNSYSTVDDRQFYVNHEAEYLSNEFQLFYDIGDNLTFTSGIFFYDSTINQRYDFYSSTSATELADPTFAQDNILATLGVPPAAVPNVPLTFLAATNPANPVGVTLDVVKAGGAGLPSDQLYLQVGPWLGDATLGSVEHGPVTPGTDTHADNRTDRKAFAVYTQGVWDINEQLTLTAGLRYAEDDIEGYEAVAQYAQTMAVADALGPALGADLNLGTLNILRGALNPVTLEPTGAVPLWLSGTPISIGFYRNLARKDSKFTYRVNLDYNIDDAQMVYGNITSGYRSGGFNLAFISQTPQYEPEELIAYEVGYKGNLLSNTLQVNASAYTYNYSSIHTFTTEACPASAAAGLNSACAVVESTSSVIAAPGATMSGIEFEVLWLATDALTIGGNFSYTNSEYDEPFFIVDGDDPTIPGSLYDGALEEAQRAVNIQGSQLQAVPEFKGSAFASYLIELASGRVELTGTASWIDDVFFSPYESQLDLAPAYERYDLRATYTSSDEQWKVSGFVNNLLNEVGIRQVFRHGAGDGFRRTAQVTEPRVYGLELTYSLN